MEIKGRCLLTGLPKLITVTSTEMMDAFEEPVERIMEAVHQVLERTPPELVADISSNGIVMTGGGSLIRGFDKLVTARTGIHTVVAENAIQCVAEGTGKSLESVGEMKDGSQRHRVILPAVFFVMGLSTIFLLLGFTASAFGSFVLQNQLLLARISGAVIPIRIPCMRRIWWRRSLIRLRACRLGRLRMAMVTVT